MKKGNWNHLTAKRVVLLKVLYDAVCAAIALTFAFLTRFALLYLEYRQEEIAPDIRERYFDFFFKYVGLFSLITVGSLAILGFYRFYPRSAKPWKPLMILGGVSLGPAIWSLLMYFTFSMPEPLFPRGVTILAWFYLLCLIGVPRMVKYYFLRQMVVDVHHHRRNTVRRVLVIGGAGYIGSQLVRDLIEQGYGVRILDSFLFGEFSIKEIANNELVDVIVGDFRNVEMVVKAMNGMDAVIHLGGIVGDPACSLDDDLTTEVNLTATMMLAEIAKVFKIERFIFASSCSVYGASSNRVLTETSPLNPVSLYARTKIASENVLLKLADENFAPTILRFSTLFGLSPRPRFDLFINLVTAKAVTEAKFTVFGGTQWRPFVHVRDVSRTIIAVLQSPLEKVNGEIFNVGSDKNCLTIGQAAERVISLVPDVQVEHIHEIDDARDYRVSFEKMQNVLGLELDVAVEEGVIEIRDAFLSGRITNYADPKYSNVKQTEMILAAFNGAENAIGGNPPKARLTARSLLQEVEQKKYVASG